MQFKKAKLVVLDEDTIRKQVSDPDVVKNSDVWASPDKIESPAVADKDYDDEVIVETVEADEAGEGGASTSDDAVKG